MRAFIAGAAMAFVCLVTTAGAQQSGGTLRIIHRDSPASLSIHEEATNSVVTPAMAMFNNLAMFDQHKTQNTMDGIVPDLAESWTWSDDRTRLTFKLRDGVTWHDGKAFTADDVKCTFDLLTGRAKERLRLNARAGWYSNLMDVTTNGKLEVTLVLNRPQPSILSMVASGYTPVYPCHVPPAKMRTDPIGTGPFMLKEFKRNELIRLVKNPNYWKRGQPYLDAIEFTIIPNRSTAMLSFVSGRADMTFPYEMTIPLVRDIKAQMPSAVCEVVTTNASTNLLVNQKVAPFNDPEVRQAVALTLDRGDFIRIMSEGQNHVGGALLPTPEGVWGLPEEILRTIPGYGGDVAGSRRQAQEIMKRQGYSPENTIKIKVSTRNIGAYRDAAVILIDQLKHVYIEAELEVIDTAIWHAKVAKRDYQIGLNVTGSGLDDPDQQFYENYACGSQRNYTDYCNKEVEALVEQQSRELDIVKRKKLVWEIDRRIQMDLARPIIMHNRGGTCMTQKVHAVTIMVNSVYNGWRFEDAWLEK
ncbi:MAG: ABC transporter substrate-binding protein [Acetobacteraceae bacterium]